MNKIRFYIGWNNDTHKLEKDKIEQVLNKHYDGYTAFEVVGYWHGDKEKSMLVELISDKSDVIHVRVAKQLKAELKQESVLLEINQVNATFV